MTDDYIAHVLSASLADGKRLARIATASSEEIRREKIEDNWEILHRIDELADALPRLALRTNSGADAVVFARLSALAEEIIALCEGR